MRRVRRIMKAAMRDRFGLTWHPSMAASIHAHLDRLDVIEVIPEGRFLDSRRARRALRDLARTVPVSIHGVSLGLATAAAIDERRLDSFARLVGEVEPESWSEHLAFVRAGGVELGHLGAPPRTAITVEATAEHIELAQRRVGSYPRVENIATPLEPPGSVMSEAAWLVEMLAASPADLLLDVHNLYSNGVNFGFDPERVLRSLPLERVRAIHIAGGVDVPDPSGGVRRVDDHLHDVPDPVYQLLEILGQLLPHPVDVVLERDGAFPAFEQMLSQLDVARAALSRGRATRSGSPTAHAGHSHGTPDRSRVSAPGNGAERRAAADFEAFLAQVYTNERTRARFLAAPIQHALAEGLAEDVARRFEHLDRFGLGLAVASFSRKRDERRPAVSGGSGRRHRSD